MKIRILHFLGRGNIGRQEKATYELLKSFINDSDIEFGVAIGQHNTFYEKKIRDLKVPIVELNLNSGFSFKFNKTLLNELKEYNIHHFHDPTPNVILLSLLSGSKIRRAFTRRGGFHDYKKNGIKVRLKYFINKLLIRNLFHGYSGNTIHATEFVRHFYNIRSKNIHVLYNGILFERLVPTVRPSDILDNLNLTNTEFKIGTACHLIDCKRVDLIIRSFCNSNINKKKLVIIGKGEDEYKLRKLAADLKIDKQVIFAGEVSNIADYLQILDCFILASGKEESFGNAVVEAMYLKRPSIIMNDSNGLKEHIIDNQTGFIAKDEKDIVNKIEYVFNNPEVSKKIAETASLYVSNKYSISNMKNSYKKYYLDILNGKN